MYIRILDRSSWQMWPAQLVTHIVRSYCHHMFRLLQQASVFISETTLKRGWREGVVAGTRDKRTAALHCLCVATSFTLIPQCSFFIHLVVINSWRYNTREQSWGFAMFPHAQVLASVCFRALGRERITSQNSTVLCVLGCRGHCPNSGTPTWSGVHPGRSWTGKEESGVCACTMYIINIEYPLLIIWLTKPWMDNPRMI